MKYFSYNHTNYFLIQSSVDNRVLAVDAGWPCSLHEYARGVKSAGYRFQDISWAIVTHFHMDHAGLIGEFIERGIECVVFENQHHAIGEMERIIAKSYPDYKKIDQSKLTQLESKNAGEFFAKIGINGTVLITPAHSPDSVAFVGDQHYAIVGDLSPPSQVMPDDTKTLDSWKTIRASGAKHIYPSHAEVFDL